MKCTAPGCNRKATMAHPKDWCDQHWDEWWKWPENQEQPEWMDTMAAFRPKPIKRKKSKKKSAIKRNR